MAMSQPNPEWASKDACTTETPPAPNILSNGLSTSLKQHSSRLSQSMTRLNNGELGGGDVKGIDVRGKTGESLLGAIGPLKCISLRIPVSTYPRHSLPDEGVELDGLDVVESLESGLDLALVGLGVDDEDEGVVLLDHLHGALGVERVDDDLGGIEARLTRDAPAGVGRGARKLEGLREVEGGAGADLADLVRVDLLGNRPSE